MFRKQLRSLALASAAAFAFAAAAASGFTKPAFPRLAGVNNSSPFNYNDTTYQANLAKLDMVILAYWPGFAPGGQSMNSIAQAIKAKNPNTLVFLYTNSNELNPSSAGAWTPWLNKLNSMKWWLYSDSRQTQMVTSTWGNGYFIVNNSTYTPKDSSGNDAIDWFTRFVVSTYYNANPSIDGIFMDNVFWKPRVSGDWQRDGIDLSADDPRAGTLLRQGYARYFSLARSLMPSSKFLIGNVADWGQPNSVLTEYQGLLNGGLMEGYIGKSYSIESWGGWANMMAYYRKTMAALGEPKLAIFHQDGNPTDYQAMRYGLGSCLLDDAYYAFTNEAVGYTGVVWFDELNVQLGLSTPPPTAAWQKGVWRRDFDNGIVLVNPKGNGPQTVTLETSYLKIRGTQDPAVNNGQSVTTVTLQDRDGIILLRKNPLKRPAAPTNLTAQQ